MHLRVVARSFPVPWVENRSWGLSDDSQVCYRFLGPGVSREFAYERVKWSAGNRRQIIRVVIRSSCQN
jgi:hypothetical protein